MGCVISYQFNSECEVENKWEGKIENDGLMEGGREAKREGCIDRDRKGEWTRRRSKESIKENKKGQAWEGKWEGRKAAVSDENRLR